jgi:Plasmid pRiA4b ORF-3-like protein
MTTIDPTPQRLMFEDPTAMQMHVAIEGIEPPIWRRLVVPLDFTLAQLHPILQAAFGWTDSHLHQFVIGGLRYGDAEFAEAERLDDDEPRTFDATEVQIKDFCLYRVDTLTFEYVYDFGDDWVHRITLEKPLVVKPAPKKAACIEGARSGPPEDVGGPHGYANFVRVLLTPEPDEIEEQRRMKRWSGGKFDPERFDLTKVDKAVRGALRRNPRGYP